MRTPRRNTTRPPTPRGPSTRTWCPRQRRDYPRTHRRTRASRQPARPRAPAACSSRRPAGRAAGAGRRRGRRSCRPSFREGGRIIALARVVGDSAEDAVQSRYGARAARFSTSNASFVNQRRGQLGPVVDADKRVGGNVPPCTGRVDAALGADTAIRLVGLVDDGDRAEGERLDRAARRPEPKRGARRRVGHVVRPALEGIASPHPKPQLST